MAPGRDPSHEPPERSGTIVETDEDIRQAIHSGPGRQGRDMPPQSRPSASTGGRPSSPFRPTVRPPVPILTVYDDGRMEGEVIRIRDQRFIIGRTEGDLRFPMDGRISSRHVEITHQVVGGLNRWVITDLQSKHGMFVRVTRTPLTDRAEFLVGNGRYRFDANQADGGATAGYVSSEPDSSETHGWSDGPGPFRPPALAELLGGEIGNRVLLAKGEYWIGSDPSCSISRPDDPFCDAHQVRLYRSSKGRWTVEHNKTQNGLWLRMPQITVESMVQFQVGEQRFRFKV